MKKHIFQNFKNKLEDSDLKKIKSSLNDHIENLKFKYYTIECMILWIKYSDGVFTKKELYEGLCLDKPNIFFEEYWRFITRNRNCGQFLSFDKELKKWVVI